MVKGVPTEVSEKDFKEFLDLNKIIYAKAERLTSKKRWQSPTNAEAEALISRNLTCNITGIIYKVEEFRSSVSVQQCWNCQSFGHSANRVGPK